MARNAWGDEIVGAGPAPSSSNVNEWGDRIDEAPPMSGDRRGANMGALRALDNQQRDAAEYRRRMGIQGDGPVDRLITGVGATGARAAAGVVAPLVEALGGDEWGANIRSRAREAQAAAGEAGGMGMAGQIAGDVAMAGVPLGAVDKVMRGSRLVKALAASRSPVVAAAGAFAPAAADVAASALYGGATTPEDRGTAAAWGAGGAAGGRVLGKALGGAARPAGGLSEDAQRMVNAGVPITPGMARGAGSLTGRTEEMLASNPLLGASIVPARRRAVEEAQVALVNSALQDLPADVGKAITRGTPAREAIDLGFERASAAFQDALEGGAIKAADSTLLGDLGMHNAIADTPMLTRRHAGELRRYVTEATERLAKHGDTVPATELKQVDAEIGAFARKLEKSLDPRDKVAAHAWRQFQGEWRNQVIKEALTSETKRSTLDAANRAWRELLTLDKALGGFDTMRPGRTVAKLADANIAGDRPVHALAKSMKATLPNTVPNSGTAERVIAAMSPFALAGGGYGAQQYLGDPFYLGSMALATGAAMSRPGTKALTGQYGWQAGARSAMPAVSAAGRGAALALTPSEREEQLRRVIEMAEELGQ